MIPTPCKPPLQFGLGSLFLLTAVVAAGASLPPIVLAFVAFVIAMTVAWLCGVIAIAFVISQAGRYTERLLDWLHHKPKRGPDGQQPLPPAV